jgi:hypothetical protein
MPPLVVLTVRGANGQPPSPGSRFHVRDRIAATARP